MDKDNDFFDKKQIIHDKNFIVDALSEYVVLNCYNNISREELNFFAKKLNWNEIPDSEVSNKIELIRNLDWKECVDKMQILRMAIRDLENIDLYPLNDFEYEAEEVIKSAKIEPRILDLITIKKGSLRPIHIIEIAKVHPSFMNRINLETEELTQEECLEIAKMGVDQILDIFDFSDIRDIDRMKIIQAHLFSEKVLQRIGAFQEDFDNKFYIREILSNTGTKFIKSLQIKYLMPSDWIVLLNGNLSFEGFVPIDDFLVGDPFFFVELCILCPSFLSFLTKDIAERITSFGWEQLFLNFRNNDQLIDLCNFDALEERSWVFFEERRPDLLLYRT